MSVLRLNWSSITKALGISNHAEGLDDPPEKEIQETIVKTFWGLLFTDPSELEGYEDRMYHSGAGVWIRFGIENGEPFMIEDSDA